MKYYITTSIAYVNARPHIGFAQELLIADVLARYHRHFGDSTFFLTGTDEHGQKVVRSAEKENKTPQEFVDEISDDFKSLTKALNISNDNFVRTTDPEHQKIAQALWQAADASGDIYRKEYEGLYCVGCEAFLLQSELVDGKCPIHKTEPEKTKEENYFFKLSKYQDQLIKHYEEHPEFIVPKTRYNEILTFIKSGLQDISISRSKDKLAWGVPVPDDDSQVMYVWFDALANYLSGISSKEQVARKEEHAARSKEEEDNSELATCHLPLATCNFPLWPADLHVIGKDILRFHAALWPAMLFSVGLPLPKQIYVHGFITVNGEKLSKSKGNFVKHEELIERFGVEGARYILLRELSATEDSDFSWDKATARYNADLANDLGNLLQRTLTMAKKVSAKSEDLSLKTTISGEIHDEYNESFQKLRLQHPLALIWREISSNNKKIDESRLWELVGSDDLEKQKEAKRILDEILGSLSEIAIWLKPYLPETSEKIEKQLASGEPKALFPRIK